MPLNPTGMGAVSADSSLNTAVSFITNTNWQGYGGETTMSYLTQMVGLTVQNFVSAAAGMAILIAFIRGFTRHNTHDLGNFWVDMTRSTLYILLPLSILVAILLVSQGVVQTFSPSITAKLIQPSVIDTGNTISTQTIAIGPAASQIAIKQLGTNGGGFFNANSAHPFENPTPISNFIAAHCTPSGAPTSTHCNGFRRSRPIPEVRCRRPALKFALERRADGSLESWIKDAKLIAFRIEHDRVALAFIADRRSDLSESRDFRYAWFEHQVEVNAVALRRRR